MLVPATFTLSSTAHLGEESGAFTFPSKLVTVNTKLHTRVIQWTRHVTQIQQVVQKTGRQYSPLFIDEGICVKKI